MKVKTPWLVRSLPSAYEDTEVPSEIAYIADAEYASSMIECVAVSMHMWPKLYGTLLMPSCII